MFKKKRFYLLAITALTVAFLLIPSVGCSPELDESMTNGIEAPDAPSTPPKAEVPPPPEPEEEEKVIFLSKRGYISQNGCPTIVGEVENAADFTMENIEISASFYCSKGRQVGGEEEVSAFASDTTEIEILAPGEISPFKIGLTPEQLAMLPNFDVNKVEKYKVVVTSYEATTEELHKSFEISQATGELNALTGHYQVTGQVKNIGDKIVEQIKVVAIFYDGKDRIIEVVHTYLENPLPPGDETEFEITVVDEPVSKRIETFHIQAVGL